MICRPSGARAACRQRGRSPDESEVTTCGEGGGGEGGGGVIYADVVQLHGGGGLRGVCSGCWAMGDEPCVAGAGIVERSLFVAMCAPVTGRE
ncbi:hypothetical protein VFPBJ_00827 [Purpureocillium lilacinum]|uniref:Uncharacterized protein n=1 Tax=Purpureocillium lilacinum TaxID=33203 RepID=A0A179H9I9_PURLI|nr:hypothetical protein VFPBJ_00827 [Purpureocillium lilacinum]